MDLLNAADIQRIISDVESSQNKTRRESEIKSFEVYSGNLNAHVEQRLEVLYPKTHASFSIADLNLSKKITDKMSKAYKQSPIRLLDSETESEEYTNLMKKMDGSRAWQLFDIYYNLHRYACMWFNFVIFKGELQLILRPLNPSQFFRIVDDIGNTRVFGVSFPDDNLFLSDDTDGQNSMIQDSMQDTYAGYKRYAIWTDEQHVVVRVGESQDSFNVIYEDIPGNEDFVNELGVIPAAFAQQGDNAALPILNPLTDQTVEFNQQYSVMLTGASVQTFGHLILSHPEDQPAPDEIYNSLFTYSKLPQRDGGAETKLDYLNPNPNLGSQLEVIKDYGGNIIKEHLGDGSQNVNSGEAFTSGLDRMIAMSDISSIIETNREVYAKAENDLYGVIKAFFEANNSFMFRSDELTVLYPKAKPIQSEQEILANIEKKLDLGLIEKHEALIMLDPNMSNEAAREKLDRIKEEKLENMNSFLVSEEQEDDDADQEG